MPRAMAPIRPNGPVKSLIRDMRPMVYVKKIVDNSNETVPPHLVCVEIMTTKAHSPTVVARSLMTELDQAN